MSENKDKKIYSFIGLARKAGALALGESLAEQAVKKGRAQLVIVACDAADNTKKKIETACYGQPVALLRFGSREEIGHIVGKTFVSVLAVIDKGFSCRIQELINQSKQNDYTAHGGGLFEQTENS